jgi:ubiquinone/menaquinone biosynthesis C-methylase UbiE
MPSKQAQPAHTKADQYNDPSHNYLEYWHGRDYEHQAGVRAIKRLLKGKHFKRAVDIGGGYGRLDPLLENYADEVTLAEPSQQQLNIARTFLHDHPKIKRSLMQANDLEFPDSSVDLITMIRVMHHLPEPDNELAEIGRVLSPDGYAIIEMANYMHAENRLKHYIRGQRFSKKPVDIRSEKNRNEAEIPFVNHNPHTFKKQLVKAGFEIDRVLSVSNLRSGTIKKLVPHKLMMITENLLQPTLAGTFFGPSIFFLVRKAK